MRSRKSTAAAGAAGLRTRKWAALSVLAAVLTVFGAGTAAPVAAAVAADSRVHSVVVETGTAKGKATLSLSFDGAGISKAEADKVRASLSRSAAVTVDRVRKVQAPPTLWCGTGLTSFDSNGQFDIAYYCSPTINTLPWGFRISTAVKAIIVGNVSETGLRWWRNGYLGGQNAAHNVPADYLFHGNMNPVWSTDHISYQDYMTFRHNLGGGGTGSLAFAGEVLLA